MNILRWVINTHLIPGFFVEGNEETDWGGLHTPGPSRRGE